MTAAEEKIKKRTKQETLLYVLSEYRKTHKMMNSTEIILNSLRRNAMLDSLKQIRKYVNDRSEQCEQFNERVSRVLR